MPYSFAAKFFWSYSCLIYDVIYCFVTYFIAVITAEVILKK